LQQQCNKRSVFLLASRFDFELYWLLIPALLNGLVQQI